MNNFFKNISSIETRTGNQWVPKTGILPAINSTIEKRLHVVNVCMLLACINMENQ